jgi:rod shape-determining protein MreC
MGFLDIRRRTGWLFATVTVAHLVLISAQVNSRRGVPLFEEAVFGGFAEVQRVASGGLASVSGVWGNYVALRDTARQNEQLRQENAQLRIGLQRERALAQQSRVLQDVLDLRSATEVTTKAAAVIAGGASPDFRTLTIDKGSEDGLRADMAVIAPEGVVGRVILPSARAAKVQLLIDRNAGAGVLIERSRAQGVVVGTGSDRLMLEYVASTADIRVGDLVVTSGTDGIYPAPALSGGIPKGFVVGRIESIEKAGLGFGEVLVRPAVDFSSLEVVLVVTGVSERSPAATPRPAGRSGGRSATGKKPNPASSPARRAGVPE